MDCQDGVCQSGIFIGVVRLVSIIIHYYVLLGPGGLVVWLGGGVVSYGLGFMSMISMKDEGVGFLGVGYSYIWPSYKLTHLFATLHCVIYQYILRLQGHGKENR